VSRDSNNKYNSAAFFCLVLIDLYKFVTLEQETNNLPPVASPCHKTKTKNKKQKQRQTPWLLVRKRTIRTEYRTSSANFSVNICWYSGVAWSARRFRTVVNLCFLDRSRYFFFQAAPHLSTRGWEDSVSDPILLRKSGSAVNRTRDLWICSHEFWPLDHRGGPGLLIWKRSIFNERISA
jgi:hypothetical protein